MEGKEGMEGYTKLWKRLGGSGNPEFKNVLNRHKPSSHHTLHNRQTLG